MGSGPGVYDYNVYWSKEDYKGQLVDGHDFNRWQSFFVTKDQISKC